MHAPDPEKRVRDREARFERTVDKKAVRKIRARRDRDRTIWSWLGMMGLVGWSVAIPTLAGVALGIWLDRRFGGNVSWTLTCLLLGVALGCWQAWYWIQRESRDD